MRGSQRRVGRMSDDEIRTFDGVAHFRVLAHLDDPNRLLEDVVAERLQTFSPGADAVEFRDVRSVTSPRRPEVAVYAEFHARVRRAPAGSHPNQERSLVDRAVAQGVVDRLGQDLAVLGLGIEVDA